MSDLQSKSLPVFEPAIEPELRPYWTAARAGRLVLPRCVVCQSVTWLPRAHCGTHRDAEVEWVEASGRGTVYSYTVVRKGEGAFADATPYVLAYIDLDEGPRVMTNVTGRLSDLDIGRKVVAVFDDRAEKGAILRFVLDLPEGDS